MDSPTINMYQQWSQQGLLGQSPSNFYNVQDYSPWNSYGKHQNFCLKLICNHLNFLLFFYYLVTDNLMSPGMAMEMNTKPNMADYQSSTNRHHVRNLWPPVGGGLPGGKPVEPAVASSASVPQRPPDHCYAQSTSYGQYKPTPTTDLPTNVNYNNSLNDGYYYKSSQNQPDPVATAINAPTVTPSAEYNRYYGQPAPQKYFPSSAVAATNHWCPPKPPPLNQMHQTSQFYHSDPTTMLKQVSLGSVMGYS